MRQQGIRTTLVFTPFSSIVNMLGGRKLNTTLDQIINELLLQRKPGI